MVFMGNLASGAHSSELPFTVQTPATRTIPQISTISHSALEPRYGTTIEERDHIPSAPSARSSG